MSLVLYRGRNKGRVAEGFYMDEEQTKVRAERSHQKPLCVWCCFGFPSPHGPATVSLRRLTASLSPL